MSLNILILGGTSEASALAGRLAGDARFAATFSLAGRTNAPRLPAMATRIGGFGGPDRLAAYLTDNAVHILIDATHPFAERISANAVAAAIATNTLLIVLTRPPWRPVVGDRWTVVNSLEAAAAALPEQPERIFLTVGRQSLIPFASHPEHTYIIRVIDPPDIPCAMIRTEIIVGRGPFEIAAETELLRSHRIDRIVTKNSGGKASAAKLAAARALGLPVTLVERPVTTGISAVTTVDEVLGVLARHQASLAKRSE